MVRASFREWQGLGIGISFEVKEVDDAEIHIAFDWDAQKSWSYIGRDCLEYGRNGQPTMTFGWDLRLQPDTSLHEIGHALGFPHEHQNPFAGIEWDEDAVYSSLAAPPNNWDNQTTYSNIIEKIPAATVKGSVWDPNSIMHYPFGPHLIKKPAQYWEPGLKPAGGLSTLDKEWVRKFYPPLEPTPPALPLREVAAADLRRAGDQANFVVEPQQTGYHNIETVGSADSLLVLFKTKNGKHHYITANDNTGTNKKGHLRVKLAKNRKYCLRVRLQQASDKFGILLTAE